MNSFFGWMRILFVAVLPLGVLAHAGPPTSTQGELRPDLHETSPQRSLIPGPRLAYVGQGVGGALVLLLESNDKSLTRGLAGMSVGCGSGTATAKGSYTYARGVLHLQTSKPLSIGTVCSYTFHTVDGNNLQLGSESGAGCPDMHSGHLCDFGFDTQTQAILKPETAGPSFSCTYVAGMLDHVPFYRQAICQNAELAFQDQIEHETYHLILPYADAIEKPILTQSEKQFHNDLKRCRKPFCLADLYSHHMGDLLAASANMPVQVHNQVLWLVSQ